VDTASSLVLIAGMAAVTFATRMPLYLLSRRRVELPRPVRLFLEQIPVAAFAAIVFPGVLAPHGDLDLSASNLYLYAALASAAVALVIRNLAATIAAGVGLAIVLGWATGSY
jgi:branched-subunit amino acid transport protein